MAENGIPELHVRRIPIGFASPEANVHDLRDDGIAVDDIGSRDPNPVDSSLIVVRADDQINGCLGRDAASAHHVNRRFHLIAGG